MPAKKKPQPRQQFFNAIRDDKATRSLDTVRWCLRHGGVNIRAEDDAGHTAVQIAAAGNKIEVLQVLCDHVRQGGLKEDLDVDDEEGRTALMMAASKGNVECVKILSKAGASWTAKSEEGMTARDYAVKKGSQPLIAMFDGGIDALMKEKKPDFADDEDDDAEAKRQEAKKWRMANLDANKQAERETAVYEARLKERDHIESTLGTAPPAQWSEVQAVLDTKGREISIVRETSDIDPALWYCITLNSLRIKVSSLTLARLPSSLAQLSALTSLIVNQCGLEELPQELSSLPRLRVLEATGNKLAVVPEALAACSGLEVLSLGNNNLTDADVVERLESLVTLNLDRNRITRLPLPQAERLKSVSAADNEIVEIPPVVGALQMLRELTLTNNKIEAVPFELSNLTPKVLQVVALQGNPIGDPRIRRFIADAKPSLVKDLLGHLQKQGPATGAKKGEGAGKKCKGKKEKVQAEGEEDIDNDGDLSALLAQINGVGSGDED